MDTDDALPISALARLLYCERRAALVHVLGVWAENAFTAAGQVLHERVDSGESTSRPGVRMLRAVRVRSERLGLAGVIDALEVHEDGAAKSFFLVETKRGKRQKWARDDVQLCAQAMAVEEMTGAAVTEGAIFYDGSKRRRGVTFTPELRLATEQAAARLHTLIAAREVPPPVADKRCPPCSLVEACQPHAALPAGSLAARLGRALE
jgi:CRISPR-associated exonuclease Cas4